MSSSDKTGDKLVQSIRKTKAAGSGTSRSHAAASKGAAAGTRKTTAKRAAKPAVQKGAPAPTTQATGAADPYQSGRRVWPD